MKLMNNPAGLFEDYKRARDAKALARLLEHHQAAVLQVCRRVLRHPQDAEDACQDVLLELSRQAGSIQEPGAFSAWLYRTALHTALDHRRRRGRARLRDTQAAAIAATETAPEVTDTLAEGLERLDEPSRALIVEHYLAGRTLRELAAERGCSEVAVWKRLRSVRDRLKTSIGGAAMAALQELPGSLWTRILLMKTAIAVPLGIAAAVGVVVLARPTPPETPVIPKQPLVAAAPAPRLAPTPPASPQAESKSTVAPPPAAPPGRSAAPRKPWPYKADAPAIPGGALWTWTVLRSAKVDLDLQDSSLEKFLGEIARQSGLRFRIDAELPRMEMSIKVSEMVVDGALRLMLGTSRMAYQIESDGAIRVGMETDIKGGFDKEAREAEKVRSELDWVADEMEHGWDGVRDVEDRTPQIEAAYAKKIVLPQGETTLRKEIDRLAKTEGIHVLIDGTAKDPQVPFLQPVEERTLKSHLEDLTRRSGLTMVPQSEEMFLLADPERAAEELAKAKTAREAHEQSLLVLTKTLGDGGPYTVQDFAQSVTSALGLPVLPSEKAWNSETSFTVAPDSTLRQALDALKSQGFRWALHEGKVVILK